MRTDCNSYNNMKHEFFMKHKNQWEVFTSPMDEYSHYSKTYYFDDGGAWYESMRPVWREVALEGITEGVKIQEKVTVKLFEVEYWNSDVAGTFQYYEKY